MAEFPTTLEQITPAFLSELLGTQVSGVEGDLVAAQGAVSTAATLRLSYEEPASGPVALFAKWSSPLEAVREMAARNGMYRREVRFYRDLAASSEIATPRCYFADWDRRSNEFLLILEDMSASRVGNFYASSLDDVRTVAEALPAFHARWWEREELRKLRWLFPLDHPAAVAGLHATYSRALEGVAERFPEEFAGALGGFARRVAAGYPELAARFGSRPVTLVHSDLHLQQVFFPGEAGGRFAVFDWQTIGRGFGGQDLARIVAMSLTPELRREHERSLVERYHHALINAGVDAYSVDACWDDYRLGMTWNVVTNVIAGASIDREAMDADAAEYGTTLGETFFGRAEAAVEELEVGEFVA